MSAPNTGLPVRQGCAGRGELRPSLEEFRRRARSFNVVPVHAEIIADTITPISAYLSLVGAGSGYLLESVEGGEKMGRYSFIGLDPWKTIRTSETDPLIEIEKTMSAYRCFRDPELPRFAGGAVGYLGYECVAYFERKLAHVRNSRDVLDIPEASFMIGGNLVVFDHPKRRVTVIVNARIESSPKDIDAAYENASDQIALIIERLKNPINQKIKTAKATARPPDEPASNFSKKDFIAAVRKAKEYIAAGDVLQVVLSQRFEKKAPSDTFDIYRALRAINPSPYMYYLNFQEPAGGRQGLAPGRQCPKPCRFAIAGSSPEVMVRLEDGRVTLRPIAGTRPRGKTEQDDVALEQELLADKKERAEHIMLVDLGRNDVGRVAVAGSVVVDQLMHIERYSHVMHIVSNVSGILDPDKTAYDLIRSAFPAGTVSGAPKVRAMEIIHELEPSARGPYAGAVGYIGFDGNADTAIVLRTVVIKDDRAYVQAGAGIVHDSVPENEFAESENKARGMLQALEWAEAGL